MAKPTTLTPEIHTKVLAAVRKGMPLRRAVALCRVPWSTWSEWMARGRKRRAAEPYLSLALDIDEALSTCQLRAIDAIDKGLKGWESRAWLLERRFPAEFGRQDRAVIDRQVSEELDLMLDRLGTALTPEAYRDVLRALAGGDEGEAASDGADGETRQ